MVRIYAKTTVKAHQEENRKWTNAPLRKHNCFTRLQNGQEGRAVEDTQVRDPGPTMALPPKVV